MIAARRRHPAFGLGTVEFLPTGNTAVLGFLRRHGSEVILVVANLASTPQSAALTLPDELRGAAVSEIRGGASFPSIGGGAYAVMLGPCGHYWLEVRARS